MTAGAWTSRPLRRTSSGERAAGRWPLRRVFMVGAGVTAAVAVLVMLLGALAVARLDDARSDLLDVVVPAQSAGQALSVALLNQETGVRGFDLTARQEFLEPYRMGVAGERDALAVLRGLSADTDLVDVGADLDAVDQAVQRWHAGYVDQAIVGAGAPPGVASADPVVGRALFEQVRAGVARLTADLDANAARARARVDAAAAFVVTVGIGVAVVLVAFLVAVGTVLRRGVLRPVSDLADQVREVVSGDMQRKVRADGPREIVELGTDVEAMRAHILRELEVLRRTNVRLDQQTRDLERSNRDLEQFAYVASHDLQEPLRKVSSFCQLLARRYGGQLDERADQYIEFAVDGAQRMQRLINDLLAFSRVGRTTERFVTVALADVATAAVAQLETARAEAGGEVVVGELPEVPGDPGLLRQLLVNLVGNGLKFGRDGVAPVVRISASRAGADWEVTVVDNGIGIEPEYADKVFVIFQRLHGRDRYPGTGIGLALAKKIIEFHGGRIRIDPPGDEPGTTVRFTLPVTQEAP